MKLWPVRRWLLWTLAVLLVLTGGAVATLWAGLSYLDHRFNEPGPLPKGGASETIVLLERGMGLASIANRLEQAGVVDDGRLFRLAVWRRGEDGALKAGEYAIPAGASMSTIATLLRDGNVLLHRLTVPEGLTTAQILRLVKDDSVLLGSLTMTPPEGSLLPDTYLYSRGETRDAMVARMAKAQKDLIAALWPGRRTDIPVDTVAEALTLASIVEKETGIASERPRVAAVFVNRLNRGMRLQSDPTIIYGLTGGEPLGRGIRQSELDKATAYNTYQIDGLPPTPIANPGRASIEAVLDPPSTNELYFVADGTGGHVFAATLAEHNQNVARWRQIERTRASSGGSP